MRKALTQDGEQYIIFFGSHDAAAIRVFANGAESMAGFTMKQVQRRLLVLISASILAWAAGPLRVSEVTE